MTRMIVAAGASGIFALACGGGTGGTGPAPVPSVVVAKAAVSGDGQAAPIGSVLPNPLRVLVSQDGAPLRRPVTWAVSPMGGSANPASSTTGADGIASSIITLPLVGTTVLITASVSGASGSPVTFTADATGAGTEVSVRVENNSFSPDVFQLKQGGTVTFTWGSSAIGHTVTPVPPNTIPTSSNPAPPDTHSAPYSFETTFPAVGTYRFYCSVHGSPNGGMHGTITVIP